MHLQFLAKLLWAKDQENTISFLRTAACQGNRKHTSFNIYGQKALGNSLAKGLKDSLVKDSFFLRSEQHPGESSFWGVGQKCSQRKKRGALGRVGTLFPHHVLFLTKLCSRKKQTVLQFFPLKFYIVP